MRRPAVFPNVHRFALASAVAVVLALAGCGSYRPLSLGWGPSRQIIPPDATGGPAAGKTPADVAAGQEDLARRVREYAASVQKQLELEHDKARQQPTGSAAIGRFEAGAAPAVPGQVIGAKPTAKTAPNRGAPVAESPAAAAAGSKPTAPDAQIGAGPAAPANILPATGTNAGPPVVLASAPAGVVLGGPDSPMVTLASAEPAVRTHQATRPNEPASAKAAPADGNTSVHAALARAIGSARAAAAAAPADLAPQLELRMLYLAAGRMAEARAPWPGGSRGEQEALAAWVQAATAMARRDGNDATGPAEALEAVERLRLQLSQLAPLKVHAVQLVSRVDGFGIVTPMAAGGLAAGRWVIVYCELENFVSTITEDSRWRTELSQRVEVLSAEGKSFLVQEDKKVVDLSANHRRDFFLARKLQLPANLPAGAYVLRVSIEDAQAGKVGEAAVHFQTR